MVALVLQVAGHLLVLELLVQPGVGWATADLPAEGIAGFADQEPAVAMWLVGCFGVVDFPRPEAADHITADCLVQFAGY